jgi:hypothetical protein
MDLSTTHDEFCEHHGIGMVIVAMAICSMGPVFVNHVFTVGNVQFTPSDVLSARLYVPIPSAEMSMYYVLAMFNTREFMLEHVETRLLEGHTVMIHNAWVWQYLLLKFQDVTGTDIFFHTAMLMNTAHTWYWATFAYDTAITSYRLPLYSRGVFLSKPGVDRLMHLVATWARKRRQNNDTRWCAGIQYVHGNLAIVFFTSMTLYVVNIDTAKYTMIAIPDMSVFIALMKTHVAKIVRMVYADLCVFLHNHGYLDVTAPIDCTLPPTPLYIHPNV